jgi:hypothetical protein
MNRIKNNNLKKNLPAANGNKTNLTFFIYNFHIFLSGPNFSDGVFPSFNCEHPAWLGKIKPGGFNHPYYNYAPDFTIQENIFKFIFTIWGHQKYTIK